VMSLGIIIPIATAIGAYFMRMRDAAKEAEGGIDTLEEQMKSAKQATTSLSDEIERLNMGFKDTAEQAFARGVREAEAAILAVQRKLDDLGSDGPVRGQSNTARQYREDLAAANELLAARRIDLKTYIKIRAELQRIKELEEKRLESVKLFFEYAQRDADLADEREAGVRQILDAVDAEKKSMSDILDLNRLILQFGKDSAQVKAKEAAIAREQYRLELINAEIKGNHLIDAMALYDANVGVTNAISDSEQKAKGLAEALKDAASAMSSLSSFGDSLDKALAVSLAKVQALKSGVDATIAGSIAGMRVDLNARMQAAKESGVDSGIVERMFGGARGKISEIEASETERKGLEEANRGSNKKGTTSETGQEALDKLVRQTESRRRLVDLTEEQARYEELLFKIQETSAGKRDPLSQKELEAAAKKIYLIEEQTRVIEEQNKVQEALASTIENSMENAFMSMVDGTKKAKDAFRDMAADIIKELYRVLVVQQMVGSFKTGGGGILGAIAPIFGKASGGTVMSNTPYLVGEKGPEVIVPQNRGHVMNADLTAKAMGNGGGEVTIVQNFNFQANGDDSVKRIIAQAAPQIAQMTKKSMIDDRRRGGQMKATFG